MGMVTVTMARERGKYTYHNQSGARHRGPFEGLCPPSGPFNHVHGSVQ